MVPVELVEFAGRRVMLITSALGMCLSMTALCYVINTGDGVFEEMEWQNDKIIILLSFYLCSYSVGWGSVVMLLYTEMVRFDVSNR